MVGCIIDIIDNIVGAADDMGLQLNISKTKYMFSTKNKSQLICSLTLGSRKFEVVKEFIYMGTQTTADNNISAEIRRRITLASRCLYGFDKPHIENAFSDNQIQTI